jgi:hypothetical protein
MVKIVNHNFDFCDQKAAQHVLCIFLGGINLRKSNTRRQGSDHKLKTPKSDINHQHESSSKQTEVRGRKYIWRENRQV